MTAFSPGLALGCFELLEMAARRDIHVSRITSDFSMIGVMPAAAVLNLAQTLRWIHTGDNGLAIISVEGNRILGSTGYESRIRQALLDYIDVIRPPWVQNATFGRAKVIAFAGRDISQVFVEAGLADGTGSDVVDFWDELAARARGQKGVRLNAIGREGERLSIKYETTRTDSTPRWISIDSNADGYDILSVAGKTDSRLLSIEVKTTSVGLAGYFHLSANEWERALTSDLHSFHLWNISGARRSLAILSKDDVEPHIPNDQGDGRWETVEIPFRSFIGMFKPMENL